MKTISYYCLKLLVMAVSLSFVTMKAEAQDKCTKPMISVYKENICRELPANFRKWNVQMHKDELQSRSKRKLFRLHMSGSGQFSEEGLKALITKIYHPGKICVVDLRAEPHGYVNGHAIYLKTVSRHENPLSFSPHSIDRREAAYLNALLGTYEVALLSNAKAKSRVEYLKVEQVATEKQLVESLGHDYIRIPVEDYRHPTDAQVERFVEFVRGLKKDAWLHFHCKAGKGRTTTFMLMYDMMHHAREIPLADFIERHWKIGGAHLQRLGHGQGERSRWANDRKRFIENFYNYCCSDHRGFKKTWSKYKRSLRSK
jgi:protein-tyrosine phosphatase